MKKIGKIISWLVVIILVLSVASLVIGFGYQLGFMDSLFEKKLNRVADIIDEECVKSPNVRLKDWCYSDMAIKYSNAEICERVSSGKDILGNSARDLCYSELAAKTGKTENIKICNKIKNKDKRESCYKDCSLKTNVEFRDICYSNEVGSKDGTDDPETCAKIQNQNSKDSCYAGVAHDLKDISKCENIVGQSWKNSCYSYFK